MFTTEARSARRKPKEFFEEMQIPYSVNFAAPKGPVAKIVSGVFN
jgi:hypothetical protein